jgi:WD40 repeat protein
MNESQCLFSDEEYLKVHNAFGIDTSQQYPIQFLNNSIIVYFIGCNIIILDVNNTNKKQIKHFKCEGHIELFKVIDFSKKNLVIIADIENQNKFTNFSIIDINLNENKILTLKKKKLSNFLISLVAVSFDMTLIACYSSASSNLIIFSFNKLEQLSKIKPIDSSKSQQKQVQDLSFFYQDSKRIFLIGDNLIKMYLYTNIGIKLIYNIESNLSLINHSWLNKNEAICLDKYSRLYIAEPKQNLIKSIHINEDDTTSYNLAKYVLVIRRVKGFFLIRSNENKIYYYNSLYNLMAIIKKKSSSLNDRYNDEHIMKICLNKSETQLAAISNKKCIYTYDLRYFFSNFNSNKKIFEFDTLVNSYNYNSITSISCSLMKPIIATCSLDRNLILWNYDTSMVELQESYTQNDEELLTVALHPSGLYLILTTTNSLRYMAIYLDSLKQIKNLNVRYCSNCIFSNGGHLFAFLHGTIIQIYSSVEFDEICSIKTQEMGKIRQLKFSLNDNYLFSCSMAGIIRIWNPYTQTQITEIMTKGLSYIGMALHPNQLWIFLISTEKSLRQLLLPKCDEYKTLIKKNGEIKLLNKLETNLEENVTCIEISNNGKLICLGMSKGSIKLFEIQNCKSKQYRGHFSSITKICFSFNDEYLISSSDDGSILFWNINPSYRSNDKNSSNNYSQFNDQILIDENNYAKISNLIKRYENKISECKFDTDIKLRSKQLLFNNKLRQLELKFNNFLIDIFNKIDLVELEEKNQIIELNKEFYKTVKDHLKRYDELNESYKIKINIENDKIKIGNQSIFLMKQECEKNEINFKYLVEKQIENKSKNFENKLNSFKEKTKNLLETHRNQIEELLNYEDCLEKEVMQEIIQINAEFSKKILDLKEENENLLIKLKQIQNDEHILRKKLEDTRKMTKNESKLLFRHSNCNSTHNELK